MIEWAERPWDIRTGLYGLGGGSVTDPHVRDGTYMSPTTDEIFSYLSKMS